MSGGGAKHTACDENDRSSSSSSSLSMQLTDAKLLSGCIFGKTVFLKKKGLSAL